MYSFFPNKSLIEAGRRSFITYQDKVLQPDCDAATDSACDWRQTGYKLIVGVIIAAIEEGYDQEHELIEMVSQVTKCRRDTVRVVLDKFDGMNGTTDLWYHDQASAYHLLQNKMVTRL